MTTNTVKHTPWTVRKYGYEKYAVENERGHQVAFTHDAEYARLIAAAPDLLAVAKAALAFIDSHVADPDLTEEMVSKYNALRLLEPHDVIRRAEAR